MRKENKTMKEWLETHGIETRVKYLHKGSLKGCWSLYSPGIKWTEELTKKLDKLGFKDFDGRPLGRFSGNGGTFSVMVRHGGIKI